MDGMGWMLGVRRLTLNVTGDHGTARRNGETTSGVRVVGPVKWREPTCSNEIYSYQRELVGHRFNSLSQ